MPKLAGSKKGDRGSTLVGAVVICTVMSIGIAGLMLSVRNTVGQESGSLSDAEAFLAAESGLLMAADWVMIAGPYNRLGGISSQNGVFTMETGGAAGGSVSVAVGVETPAAADMPAGVEVTDNLLKLRSTASHPNLPYDKRLEWIVEAIDSARTVRKIGWKEINAPKY
jgi:hypothetical protein